VAATFSESLGALLNTVSVSFRDVKVAQQVIPLLGDKVACSAGAACHSHGTHSVSAVLLAIKVCPSPSVGRSLLSLWQRSRRSISSGLCVSRSVGTPRKRRSSARWRNSRRLSRRVGTTEGGVGDLIHNIYSSSLPSFSSFCGCGWAHVMMFTGSISADPVPEL
jgi:hypothetical protein